MTADDVRPSAPLTIAGLALLVVPFVAIVVKFASFGWMMVLVIYTIVVPFALFVGWILQVVIASTGYFGRRGLFVGPGRTRAIAAAWTTSAGVLLLALTFVDGGDTSWGSTLMYWTGTTGDHGVADVSTGLAWLALIPWLGGWLWLVVEWIVAIVRRARGRRTLAR